MIQSNELVSMSETLVGVRMGHGLRTSALAEAKAEAVAKAAIKNDCLKMSEAQFQDHLAEFRQTNKWKPDPEPRESSKSCLDMSMQEFETYMDSYRRRCSWW